VKLNEKLNTKEQVFLSKLLDELVAGYYIDWDKSDDSIYLIDTKITEFEKEYKEKIPGEYFNAFSSCLHPETWEKLSRLTCCRDGFTFGFWEHAAGELIIPDGVQTIPKSTFSYCLNLTSISIPTSVSLIKSWAFADCCSLADIKIPDSVKTIEKFAFTGCQELTSVLLPNDITRIADGTFSSCRALNSVTIPPSVSSLGTAAFNGCAALTSIVLPGAITCIPVNCFESCRSLTSVTLPNKLSRVESGAFNNCPHLSSITIPESVTYISAYAFSNCCNLTVETKNTYVARVLAEWDKNRVKLIESFHLKEAMIEFKEEVERVHSVFDFAFLDDVDIDWIFAGFYTEFAAPRPSLIPSFAKGVPSFVDANAMVDGKMGLKYQRLLTREAELQGFENAQQFYTALILAVHPEYKVVRVEGTDYFIVKEQMVQELLNSNYFKGYSANCTVEVL
jgi:hypothetical protein